MSLSIKPNSLGNGATIAGIAMTLGILRYLTYLPIFMLATVATYVLVPFLVLFQKDGWLPVVR